jgi:hypothetical protein
MLALPSTWIYGATGVVLVGLCLALAASEYRITKRDATIASLRADWAKEREELAATALRETEKTRALEQAQHDREREAQNAAQKALAQRDQDLAVALTAADRLRQRTIAATGRCITAGSPSAATTGAPEPATGDLLAELQRRLDEAAGQLADYADRAVIDARSCEAAWPH